MDLLLGLDIGTSATKGVICDSAGRVVASASADHTVSAPHPGWSEQDPEMWWRATIRVVRALLDRLASEPGASRTGIAERIAAIGLSGQMHGSVFLPRGAAESDGQAAALWPAMLWNDQRTAAECAAIEASVGGRRQLVSLVGNAALTGFTLPKVLWLRTNEPDKFAAAATLLLPKDFVRFRLTGELATDVGDASGTLLFDIDRRTWRDDMFALVGLDRGLVPRAQESATVAGRVSAWAAEQTGLRANTPVVAGSGDNMCGAIGAGVVESGIVLATLGTSGVIYAHSAAARRDLLDPTAPGRLHTMCAADGAERPGNWCVTGCMLSAAGALQWARGVLAPESSYEMLIDEASKSPPGARGLIFLPYLTGERCPPADPDARGAWLGLTARHSRGDLLRAVLEGVTFGMRQILDLVRGVGVPVTRIRLGGGGAKSTFWRQLQADIYEHPVEVIVGDEGPALGAALLSGVGVGVWTGVEQACREVVRVEHAVAPDRDVARRYDESRDAYARSYQCLKAEFPSLARIDQS